MATMPSWGQTEGPTEYLVIDDRIVALLYWSGAALGHEGGPDGEPVVTDSGWFWVATDDPDNHSQVHAPPLREDMSYDELAAAWDAARAEATREAVAWLTRGRG
jgi:hypothetical protein